MDVKLTSREQRMNALLRKIRAWDCDYVYAVLDDLVEYIALYQREYDAEPDIVDIGVPSAPTDIDWPELVAADHSGLAIVFNTQTVTRYKSDGEPIPDLELMVEELPNEKDDEG